MSCFLRFFTAEVLHCFVGGDVSFVLRSMEEGEGEDGDGCCTLDVQEYVCQGVSVLMLGSSRSSSSGDETQLWGWIGNDLFSAWSARLASGWSKLGRS